MANIYDPVIVHDTTTADYWNSQTKMSDTQMVPLAAALVTGSLMNVIFSRTVPAGAREDFAMMGFHFSVEAGPGAPMSRLDSADAARVENAFDAGAWQGCYTTIANDWTLKEYNWRHFGADFPQDKNGLSKNGPIWRITPIGTTGTNTSPRLPDQVAATVTYRTASRAHWGRNYWGGFTTSSVAEAQLGHILPATVDLLAGSTHTFLNNIADDARKTNMWIWSPKYRGACAVNEISVDDTWDIIRSRRAKFPTYRKTYTS
jgi:hypothetical protein